MPPEPTKAGGPRADPALAGLPVAIVAWFHIGLASIGLAAGLAVFAMLWSPQKPYLAPALVIWAWPVTLALLLLLAPLAGGIGLLRHRPWARNLIIAVSAIYLFMFPFGTALGGAGLWVLLRRRQAPVAYVTQVLRRKGGRGALVLVVAASAALLAAIIAAGYGLDRLGYTLPRPPPGARLFLGLVALAVGGVALVVQPLVRGWSARRIDTAAAQSRRQRIARLRADPATHRFANLLERGQHWSDAQIAYALDRTMLATCVHLQPAERAMRAEGLECKPTYPAILAVECRLDEAALGPVFPVSYREWLQSDRGEAGSPHAALHCEACRWSIQVVHPADATPATPWFPGASPDGPRVR